MVQASTIFQHQCWRPAYPVAFLSQPPFIQDDLKRFSTLKQPCEMWYIQASLAGDIQHDLAFANVTALSKKSLPDAQVILAPCIFALLGCAPGSLKGGQGGCRPVIPSKGDKIGGRFLKGGQPHFLFQHTPVWRAAAKNLKRKRPLAKPDFTFVFGANFMQAHGCNIAPRSVIFCPFPQLRKLAFIHISLCIYISLTSFRRISIFLLLNWVWIWIGNQLTRLIDFTQNTPKKNTAEASLSQIINHSLTIWLLPI